MGLALNTVWVSLKTAPFQSYHTAFKAELKRCPLWVFFSSHLWPVSAWASDTVMLGARWLQKVAKNVLLSVKLD